MLRDADRSLANWLGQVLPPGAGIRFEAPTARWLAEPPEPLFVSVFLHDIRQDERGRQSGWSDVRDSDGRVVARQPTTQYYRLTYLVSVWATVSSAGARKADRDAGDQVLTEHETLGALLERCAHNSVLPADCLEGALAETGLAPVLECAPAQSSPASSVWSGFGLPPRACLALALIAPARPPAVTDIAPPAREIVLGAAHRTPAISGQAAAPGTSSTSETFGTKRRWEKQTIKESSAT